MVAGRAPFNPGCWRGPAWLVPRRDHPTLTDCSLWGLLAPPIYAPFLTPCMMYARTLSPLVAFIERARARFFPELAAPAAFAAA
jgi:hypothetical protein